MAGRELSGTAYLQGKPCPKCGYVRTAADTNPDWQCPKCQIAYAKFRAGGSQLTSRIAAGGREMAAEAKADHSLRALVVTNLVAVAIAFVTGMNLPDLMMVYWVQSVIIGISFYIRILKLRRFSTEGLTMNDQLLGRDAAARRGVANFFALHFGIFHGVYLAFIVALAGRMGLVEIAGFLVCAIAFAVNHTYSLQQNIRRDALGTPNIGMLMFLPYARILPMHLTILLGVFLFEGAPAFFLFAILKLIADVAMHTVEHHVLAKGSVLPPPD